MDIDEDDDFYAPEESTPAVETKEEPPKSEEPAVKPEEDEDLEEGEEEDDLGSGSDSDIDIITEHKDGATAPPSQPRYNEIRNIPSRTGTEVVTKPAATVKKEKAKSTRQGSGADLPGIATSKIDIDGKPVYSPAGKPITQVNIDEDLPENDKPWRRPGTDMSDYFNYGFDEFTWALYAAKQESLRSEYDQTKIAANQKKMFEDMNMMMAMGAMPGMIPGANSGAGMEGGMPPDMQAMMQQMMASGMDPSQMDPGAMFAGMGGGNAAAAGGQGFGGQGGNQYGYEGGQGGGGGGGGGGNEGRRGGGNFGGGRGRRGRGGGGQW